MREQARDKGRLQDMIEAANNVEEFVAGVAFEQFVQGFYFQKILRAANLRLRNMTEGR